MTLYILIFTEKCFDFLNWEHTMAHESPTLTRWPQRVMLLLLRDYATFDYAK